LESSEEGKKKESQSIVKKKGEMTKHIRVTVPRMAITGNRRLGNAKRNIQEAQAEDRKKKNFPKEDGEASSGGTTKNPKNRQKGVRRQKLGA